MSSHKAGGWTFDPEPKDLEKFESVLLKNNNNGKSKVAEAAEANLSGDGIMTGNKPGSIS